MENHIPSTESARQMGAKGGPIIEAERLAFEAWMDGHCWGLDAEWNGVGYKSQNEMGNFVDHKATRTRMLWAAWRDRGALAAQAVQSNEPAPGRIETPEFVAEFQQDAATKEAVFNRVLQYYETHEAFAGEAINQSDDPIIDAPRVMTDIADNILRFNVVYKDD